MNTIARLASHLLAFSATVAALRPSAVAPAALLSLYVAGAVFVLLAPRHRLYPRLPGTWAATLGYAVLLAAIFAGAGFAMGALGNSLRPRAVLPAAFGGVELYWLLVLGVASVAVGALVGTLLEGLQVPSSAPTSAAAGEA